MRARGTEYWRTAKSCKRVITCSALHEVKLLCSAFVQSLPASCCLLLSLLSPSSRQLSINQSINQSKKRPQFLPHNATQIAVMRLYIVCLSVRPSVWLSATFGYRHHIGWNTSKLISRPNSPCSYWSQRPQNYGEIVVGQEHKKPAISPKRCKIGPRLLRRTNRKSHFDWCQIQWPWMTLNG